MKNKQYFILAIGACCTTAWSYSQEVISGCGEYFETSSVSVSFTIGEPVTNTFDYGDYILTQGFQQPQQIDVGTRLTAPELTFEINIFPNPADNYLILETDCFEGLNFILYDLDGKMLEKRDILANQTEICTSGLKPSTYFLHVLDNELVLKIFKIIKE
jgi:hypothetical protein